MSQLLDKDFSTRLGCGEGGYAELSAHPFFQSINWTRLMTGHLEPPFIPNVGHSHCVVTIVVLVDGRERQSMLEMYWTLILSHQ